MSSKPVIKIKPKTETVSRASQAVEITPALQEELGQLAKNVKPTSVNLAHYRVKKKAISIRIDADVLSWFQSQPGKYQRLINKACRAYMESAEAGQSL